MKNENMIAALKRERAAYEARGEADRVAQVDEQLAHYGYKPPADGPQGRTGKDPQQQTTAAAGTQAEKKPAAKKAAPSKPQE